MGDPRVVEVSSPTTHSSTGYHVSGTLVSVPAGESIDSSTRVRFDGQDHWYSAVRTWPPDDAADGVALLRVQDPDFPGADATAPSDEPVDGRDDRSVERCESVFGRCHQRTAAARLRHARTDETTEADRRVELVAVGELIQRVWGKEFLDDSGVDDADADRLTAIVEPDDPRLVDRMLILAESAGCEPPLAVLRYEWVLTALARLCGADSSACDTIRHRVDAVAAHPDAPCPTTSDEVMTVRGVLAERCLARDVDAAEELLRDMLAGVHDEMNPGVFRARYLLGVVCAVRDRLDEAVDLLRRALNGHVAADTDADSEACEIRLELADVHMRQGELPEAIALLEWFVADDGTMAAGDEFDDVRFHLAVAYRKAGRVSRALPLLARLVTEIDAGQRDDPHDTVMVRHELAKVHEVIGAWGHALPLYEQAAADSRRLLPAGDPFVVITANDAARALAESGERDRARQMLERLAAEAVDTYGEDNVLADIVARNLRGLDE